MHFAALPGSARKVFLNSCNQASVCVWNDERRCLKSTLFQFVKKLRVTLTGFLEHGLYCKNFPHPLCIYAADNLNRHADDTATIANFLIQRIYPQHRITVAVQRSISECVNLFVQFFGHIAYLGARQIVNPQTFCQTFHFACGNAVDVGLLYDLNQGCLTALAITHEKRYIAALTDFRHHQINRAHTGVEPAWSITRTVAASFRWVFWFIRTDFRGDFRFHKLVAQPLQHRQHWIRLRNTFQ